VALIIGLAPATAGAAQAGLVASPLLVMGPKAIPAAVVGPSYSLFECQLGLDPDGSACYDPYQIRHAYGVDTLISAGLTGKGTTIVIIDAFQSPNIVQQLTYWDAFYGLPA
jgi:subtilase family serine protease